MKILGGNIFTEQGCFKNGNLSIKDDKITAIDFGTMENGLSENGEEAVISAQNYYVLPGFVDIHMHGCAGADFCEAKKEAFAVIEEYQMRNGVTTVFPATMTLPKEKLEPVFESANEFIEMSPYNVIGGITMEGPFLSEDKKGAQAANFIQKPDLHFFEGVWEKSGGLISQIAVAPEEEGALEFIQEVSKKTVVSLAHSTADYKNADLAFKAGATHVTHLFNGMNPFLHREPGIVGAAFDNSNVFVELICDGVHIHPAMVRAAFKLFGAERICMISDSLSAAGMSDGEYVLGGQTIIKKGDLVMLPDGTLAGSACNLYDCFKKTVLEMQIPLEEAVLSCTKTPAKSLGADKKCGSIKEGRNADLLIVDEKLNIKYIIKNGNLIMR